MRTSDTGSKGLWFRGWRTRDGNPFVIQRMSYRCDRKGRRKGGGKGRITESENDIGTQAISH